MKKKKQQKNSQYIYYSQIKQLANTNYGRQFVLNSKLVSATLNCVPVKLLQ